MAEKREIYRLWTFPFTFSSIQNLLDLNWLLSVLKYLMVKNVTKIAQSKGSENEAFVIGDHVLSVQSHPEFNGAMITKRIFQTLCEKGILNDEKEANECKESVLNDKVNDSNTIFRNVVRKFLNRDFTLRKNFL